jgi:4a-hydroxytetrahydrobiopterin dehydratase
MTYDKLDEAGIAHELGTVDGWAIDRGALTKEFAFERYKDGLVFAGAVGFVADELNHHPDLFVGYGKVRVSMVTHDADGGLTAFDFELARRIDRLGK